MLYVDCVNALLVAGADPNQYVSNKAGTTVNCSPLEFTMEMSSLFQSRPRDRRLVQRLLLKFGAHPEVFDEYTHQVFLGGGFPAYEKAHRTRLAKAFARVVFPRIPIEVVSHVVVFAFHIGYY